MLLLCMFDLERMRNVAVGGVVDRRGWWRMVVLHGNEHHGAVPNELTPGSSCNDLVLDACTMLWTTGMSPRSALRSTRQYDMLAAPCKDICLAGPGDLVGSRRPPWVGVRASATATKNVCKHSATAPDPQRHPQRVQHRLQPTHPHGAHQEPLPPLPQHQARHVDLHLRVLCGRVLWNRDLGHDVVGHWRVVAMASAKR